MKDGEEKFEKIVITKEQFKERANELKKELLAEIKEAAAEAYRE